MIRDVFGARISMENSQIATPKALNQTHRALLRRLYAFAGANSIRFDPRDVTFSEIPADDGEHTVVEAVWSALPGEPKELHGGPMDGHTMMVDGEPLELVVAMTVEEPALGLAVAAERPADAERAAGHPRPGQDLRYVKAGINDTTVRWAYQFDRSL